MARRDILRRRTNYSRYRGEADIAFVASRRWVYGYTA